MASSHAADPDKSVDNISTASSIKHVINIFGENATSIICSRHQDLIPQEAVGRTLNPEEVRELIREVETRLIPKGPVGRPRSGTTLVGKVPRDLH